MIPKEERVKRAAEFLDVRARAIRSGCDAHHGRTLRAGRPKPSARVERADRACARVRDGARWIAEVPELAGTLVYGETQQEATAKAKALALRVLADQLEHGETDASLDDISFAAA